VGDLIESLSLPEPSYDLVLATDVFIYIGKLDEVFAACQQILRPAGLFAFSVEAEETGPDYALRPSGRYGHSAAYIRRLAEQHGFAGMSGCHVTLRKEAGVPMPGNLFVFKRS
jgi:predicted TPR repeat methyltransferase